MNDALLLDPLRGGRRGSDVSEFWRRLQAGSPAFQRCSACGTFRFPPGAGCPSCGSLEHAWVEPRTRAEVGAWTVTHPAAAARLPSKLRARTPYVLLTVEFPDISGVLLPALLDGVGNGDLVSGAAVRLDAGSDTHPRITATLVGS
jgi:uncharacterized OB-fold protein